MLHYFKLTILKKLLIWFIAENDLRHNEQLIIQQATTVVDEYLKE